MKKTIDIIGAGIGGLSTALALKRRGFDVRIFEQSKKLTHTGSGIILATNAMQIYETLGLKEEIERKGNILSSINITKQNLEPISIMDLKYFRTKYKVNTVAIHRGDLQKILLNALKDVEINLGYKLTNIISYDSDNVLEFENTIAKESAIIIGADGLHSKVRELLFEKTILREAKQVCWRGVSTQNLSPSYMESLYELWGDEARFGFVKISNTQTYWYALKSFNSSAKEHKLDNIETYFSNFHPLIKKILSSTPKDNIHCSEIIDFKPLKIWHKNNICLLGDATHAMTPNMGQGACQAIEDAYTLAQCLDKYDKNKAFSKYQKMRYDKVVKIVKTSWIMGKIAHLKNPLLIKLRNCILTSIPVSMNRKQSEEIFKRKES